MFITKQKLLDIIKEEVKKTLLELKVDDRTGYPLDDEAWSDSEISQKFLNSQIGKVWFGAHKQSGGKFNNMTGVPIGGLKNFPAEKLYPYMDMIDQGNANIEKINKSQADSQKYYNDKIAANRAQTDAKISGYNADLTAAKQELARIEKEAKDAADEAIAKLDALKNARVNTSSQNAITSLKKAEDALDSAYNVLRTEYNLNKKLKADLETAPEKASQKEVQIFKKIVQPYLDQTEQILNTDKINTPEQLNNYLKTVYEPYIKKSGQIINQFSAEVEKSGAKLSKPYVKMLASSSDQRLNFARKDVQFWRKEVEDIQKFIK